MCETDPILRRELKDIWKGMLLHLHLLIILYSVFIIIYSCFLCSWKTQIPSQIHSGYIYQLPGLLYCKTSLSTHFKKLQDNLKYYSGLPINYKTCSKILKRDSVFCDYFNAFLSLPVSWIFILSRYLRIIIKFIQKRVKGPGGVPKADFNFLISSDRVE